MSLHPAAKTELQKPYFITALMIEIILPLKTVRIVDGAGELHWGGQIYRGSDSVFGTLVAIDPLQEQVATEAPMLRMKMAPQGAFDKSYITNPANQGAPINIYFATVSPATGLIVGEPMHLFAGELDSAEVDEDTAETTVTLDVASVWDRLFRNGEGRRLNNANHQRVWAESAASERGFEYVVAIQRNEPWGYAGPRPPIVADTIGGQPPAYSGLVGGSGGSGGGGSVSGRIGGIDHNLLY